jgi:hypothetical protein
MPELITKIRSRKWLFVLLIAPLVFTPLYMVDGGNRRYAGLSIGPQIAIPLDIKNRGRAHVEYWDSGRKPYDFDSDADRSPSYYFIDWGRIAYWELWVLLIYFCIVPWCFTWCCTRWKQIKVIVKWGFETKTMKQDRERTR